MDVFSLFRKAPEQQQQQPQNQQQSPNQNQGQVQGQPDPGNQQQRNAASVGPNANDPNRIPNPLDVFKDLWKTSDNNTSAAPTFSIPQEAISKAAQSIDFGQFIPQEIKQKIASGDTSAMLEAMNHIARAAYGTALQHQSALTDKFVTARSEYDSKGLSQQVKQQLALTGLSSVPNADNPVIQENLRMIAGNLSSKYPDASPDWIQQQARQFFVEIAKSISPDQFAGSQQTQKGNAETGFDWENWLTNQPQKPPAGNS